MMKKKMMMMRSTPPLSDLEGEKLYHDAEEMESYEVEASVPIRRLQTLLVHLGITTAPK
jgi:hypothetical protein